MTKFDEGSKQKFCILKTFESALLGLNRCLLLKLKPAGFGTLLMQNLDRPAWQACWLVRIPLLLRT